MTNPTISRIQIKVITRWLVLLAMVTTAPNPATAQEGGTQGVEVAAVGSCALTGGTGGISGQVTIPGGAPQQFAQMTLYSADGRSVTTTSTNAAGNYAFSGLRAGNFILRAFPAANTSYAHEWYNNQAGPLTATPIAVTDGVTTTANIQLALGTQISGQVTASDGGPLQYVRVAVYNSQGETVANDFSTDAGGNYTTSPGLPSGQYRVYFSEPSGRPYFDEYYNDQPNLDSATVINVTAPAPVANLNATLTRGAQITGRVTHAISGLPVQAGVSVYGEGGNDFGFVDGNGYYTTTAGLRSGTYTVTFQRVFESQNLYGASQVVTVTAPNTLTGVNGTLSPGGQITGRITTTGGAPISGAYAYVSNDDGSFQDYFTTNASGVYTATAMPSGAYSLLFFGNGFLREYYNDKPVDSQPDLVSVTAPNLIAGIDAVLAAGGGISGTVTAADTGLPLRDVDVRAYDASGDNVESVSVNASGQYAFSNLRSGQYRLHFEPRSNGRACGYQEEWYSDKATMETADSIAVTAGVVTPNINVSLARGSALMGQVVDAVTAVPLDDISIDVYDVSGRRVARGQTNFLGHYLTSPALPGGAYRVRFSDYDQGYIDEYYNDKSSLSAADAVNVTAPNDVTGISAALAKGGFISGQVLAADTGLGLQYVDVTVYNASGEPVGYGYTKSDGSYTVLSGLATGNYRVEFNPPSGQGPALAASSLLLRESTLPASETDSTGPEAEAEESELTLGPTLELARTMPLNVGVAEGGFGSGYLPQFYNNKRTLAEADLVSVVAPTNTNDINAVLLRGLFLPLIQR